GGVSEMSRGVTGDAQSLEGGGREVQHVVAVESHVRAIGSELDPGRREAVQVLEQDAFVLCHVDGRAGRLREVRNRAEMIPVTMRDEDRDADGAQALERV